MAQPVKGLRFDIDPEGNNHKVKEVKDGAESPAPEISLGDLSGITKIETATLIYTKKNPTCITYYFRGKLYQV